MSRSRSLIAALKNVSPRRSTRPPARRISLIRAAPQPRRPGQLRAATALRRLSSDAPRFANGAPLADSKMGAAASCVGSKEDPITSGDVEVAQEAWAKGIVDIGKVYQDKGD